MKKKLPLAILSVLLIIVSFGKMKAQENSFKGKRYSFDLLDSKNPTFSEKELIKDLSTINGVFRCKYLVDKKVMLIYATGQIDLPTVQAELVKHHLGILNFVEENIKVSNLDSDNYEKK